MVRRISCLTIALALIASAAPADTTLRRTTLLVADLDRSVAFYSALGLRPYYDARRSRKRDGNVIGQADLPLAGEPGSSRMVILIGPDTDTGMIGLLGYGKPALADARAPIEGQGVGDVILMLTVDDIQDSFQTLSALGTRFHREPYRYQVRDDSGTVKSSGWRMFAYDPDDRLIEIAQRR